MQYNIIRKIAYIYISLPLLIFSSLWLNAFSALICVSCLLGALYLILKDKEMANSSEYVISRKTVLGVIFIAVLWVFLSGIGGYWYQAGDFSLSDDIDNTSPRDFSARNAIYRDLINYSWPVYYSEQNLTLNYYFGFWLPPALITKFFSLFISSNLFIIGLHILALWAALGIAIFLFLILYITTPQNTFLKTITLLLPLFFSGLDIVGAASLGTYNHWHLEWWAIISQYSSLTTLLFWVFNQTIISWICTLLFFYERDAKNVGFLFICTLFCGPFASVGLAIIIIVWLYYTLLQATFQNNVDSIKKRMHRILSYQNFFMLPFLVLLYFFFSANTIVQNRSFRIDTWTMHDYLQFCFIEFAIYAVLIFKYFKKDVVFITILFSLFFLCFFDFEGNSDFSMRSTIPAILLLMIYIAKYINSTDVFDFRKIILAALLVIGGVTPLYEMKRGFTHLLETGSILHREDAFITLGDKDIRTRPFYNFLLKDPQKMFFYKYFAKELKNNN